MKKLFLFSLLVLSLTPAARSEEIGKPSMDLPRYNLDTTLADLKIGIPAENVRRILGNPRTIRHYGAMEQWVYARGYIYIRDGKLEAMQNLYGGVFAH